MATKKKKTKPAKNKNTAQKRKVKSFDTIKFFKRFLITLCFVGVIAVPVIAYVQQSEAEHDLSVLGNGTPTVVQIHDPNCQMCQQLKRNLGKVKGDFKDNIQFKTANIKTQKGSRFANRYNVPHVTLLFFDKSGKRVNTIQGVTPSNEIKSALQTLSTSR
ncbi:MAG: thioredoxin family protein [Cellvibrionaceae bacterium]